MIEKKGVEGGGEGVVVGEVFQNIRYSWIGALRVKMLSANIIEI